MGGKTRNIAIQLVLLQCCKTSCTFYCCLFSVPKINDSPRFTPKSNLEEFVWRYQSITGLITQRQFAAYNAGFWYVGLLDVVLLEYLEKSDNFTNLILYDVTL